MDFSMLRNLSDKTYLVPQSYATTAQRAQTYIRLSASCCTHVSVAKSQPYYRRVRMV